MMLRAVLFSVAMVVAAGMARGQDTPACGNVFVDAQIVLSGAGWLNVQSNAGAWAALPAALVSDLGQLLGRSAAQMNIETLTAGANSLTVVFTARSDAIAEAARIAVIARDVISATSPLPATKGVYSSVGGQSSNDVTIASHNGMSRGVFDSTCAATSSNGNEVTTAAPATSSSNNEVTTAAPATNAPSCGSVFIDGQIVLSGAGWLNVQGNAGAWAALPGALTSDLAVFLGRTADEIDIQTIAAGANSLTVVFTARSNAIAEAARIAVLLRDVMSAASPLPATKGVYSSVGGQSSNDVTIASHNGLSRGVFDSTCAASSSNGNEVTTAAPETMTSSNGNEVTTAAPVPPPTPTPTSQQWVFIDAQFVLSGAGWLNVRGNAGAWAALPGAFASDAAFLVGRTAADISISSLAAGANSLTIVFTVRSDSLAQAARIAALIRDNVPAAAPLPATKGVYSSVGGQSSNDVSVASTTAASRDVLQSSASGEANAVADQGAVSNDISVTASSAMPQLWLMSAVVGLATAVLVV